MANQDYRVLLTSGRKVLIKGVTATPTKADIPYYDGQDYRDVNNPLALFIPNPVGAQPMVTSTPITGSPDTVTIAENNALVADDTLHVAPRNQQHMMTVYQFTLVSGLVMEIPFANVDAMYTDEAT